MKARDLFLGAVIGMFFFLSCSQSLGGAGGETTNGVTARLIRKDGTPAAGAVVRLRQSTYVEQLVHSVKSAVNGIDTVTDAAGRFHIAGIGEGNYSVEVSDSGAAILFTCSLTAHDTVNFGTDTLLPEASVTGAIDTAGMSGRKLYVQVLGLECLAPVDSAGGFTINDLPAGLFGLRIVAAAANQLTVVGNDQVSALSGDTVRVTMQGWSFAQKLYLNTSAGGANVTSSVCDFPVLIRLTGTNFNFSRASADGSDIRFTRPDNTPLPFEIEHWDATLNQAEIWVRVDTVFGNDSTHFITMCWGNPGATNASGGEAVFDTSNGFQGVWHLGQSASAIAADATVNHFDGAPSDSSPQAVQGIIGMCREFNGVTNFIQMPGTASGKLNFPEGGTYSVGAWVYAYTLDTAFQKIIDKNNFQYKLQIDYFNAWSFSEYDNATGYSLTNYPATAGQWVYLVGVRSGGSQYLYVNGQCVNNSITIQPDNTGRKTATNLTVGRYAEPSLGCYFKGRIDEVRIENEALSADWIKLCYMNQNVVDALVKFK